MVEERDRWTTKFGFLMSVISYAVGLSNLWRFPYLCYRHGGGAFLFVYILIVIVLGWPMVMLEMSIGQFGQKGAVKVWKSVPLFSGVGYGMVIVTFSVMIYYNILIAYFVCYIFASFQSVLPWSNCNNAWNTPACLDMDEAELIRDCTATNGTYVNGTCFNETTAMLQGIVATTFKRISPSDEYFHFEMLGLSSGLESLGHIQWRLLLCLLLVWLIVIATLWQGTVSLGKVSYLTTILPYVTLPIMLIRGVTLPGSGDGIVFYIKPDFSQLANGKLWSDAASQVFFSLSLSMGGLITMASHNTHNHNYRRDSIIMVVADTLTSIFGGFVVFAFLGHMAYVLDTDVPNVATQGAGLAFIVFAEAITTLPVSQLWSVLYMLTLVTLGIGTTFGEVLTLTDSIKDQFSWFRGKWRSKMLLVGLVSIIVLIELPLVTQGGMYIVQLLDAFIVPYTVLYYGLILALVFSWVYGLSRLADDIESMLGWRPGVTLKLVWGVLAPPLLLALLVGAFIDYERLSYHDYDYPLHYEAIGWVILIIEFLIVPAVAIYLIIRRKGPVKERIHELVQSDADWGTDHYHG